MSVLTANLLLLTAAIIWGSAFVAQRVGMDYIGPFLFTGVRFALGSLSLLPLMIFYKPNIPQPSEKKYMLALSGLVVGLVLFLAVSFQQVGIIYTSVGKAGFITCLYIVIVPVIGIFLGKKTSVNTWISCFISLAGLYLLSIKSDFSIAYGDLLILVGAFLWAGHILVIDYFAKKVDVLKLSCMQFAVCSVLSLAVALIYEPISLAALKSAAFPIVYGGVFSVGVGYTLQVFGQKKAPPTHAAIILSMETVVAAICGYLFLSEVLSARELTGCALMFAGMILSQLGGLKRKNKE